LITLFLSCYSNAIISNAYFDFSFISRVSQGSDDEEEHVHNGYIEIPKYSDNSVTFIPGYSYNVSSRTKTSASVTWLNVPAWDTRPQWKWRLLTPKYW